MSTEKRKVETYNTSSYGEVKGAIVSQNLNTVNIKLSAAIEVGKQKFAKGEVITVRKSDIEDFEDKYLNTNVNR